MKIAVFLSRFPYPLIKGDKLRAYNQIVQLAKRHEVYLFCLSDERIENDWIKQLRPFCKEIEIGKLNKFSSLLNVSLAFFSQLPLQTAFYKSNKIKQQYNAFLQKVKPDVCYYQFVRTMPYAEGVALPQVLDFQDTLSANMERRAGKSNAFLKPFFLMEAKRLRRYELKAMNLFDAQTIITDADRQLLPSNAKNKVAIVSNGVSQRYVDEVETKEKKYDVLFCGNMGYKPNITAADYLIRSIMPLVRKQRPQTTLCIAGVNPPNAIKAMANKMNLIVEKVDDMRQMYLQSKVFIAPMQIGTGLQNKLLEAMSCEIPSISSPLANNALQAEHNKEILIANKDQEYADCILKLLNDESLAKKLATNGREYILENFRWEKCNEELEKVLAKVVSHKD